MQGSFGVAVLFSLLAASAGCDSSPTDPSAPGGRIELLQVQQVNVLVAGFPPQVSVQVQVQGILTDGCSSLDRISQQRDGNTIVVTVTTRRSGEVCTQIVTLVDRQIPLDGAFPPGEYIVRVNNVERRFRI